MKISNLHGTNGNVVPQTTTISFQFQELLKNVGQILNISQK